MSQMKIDGMGSITGGTYDEIKINGAGKVTDDVEFDSLKIDGACKALGSLVGKEIKINGELKAEKDIRVKQVKINGSVKSEEGKIYADEIWVDGVLVNDGEVNADTIKIDGRVSLNDVYGDKIYMNPMTRKFLFFQCDKGRNCVKTIECSYLEAADLDCDTVCAAEIRLSGNCRIGHITCDGKLTYEQGCKIGTIEGDCEIIVE